MSNLPSGVEAESRREKEGEGFYLRRRVIRALRDRFVGAGCHDVDYTTDRYARLLIPGWQPRITANLPGLLRKEGVGELSRTMTDNDQVLFVVPMGSKTLDTGLAIIPIDTFIDLYANRKER